MTEPEFNPENEPVQAAKAVSPKEPENKSPKKSILCNLFDFVEAIVFAAVLAIVVLTIFVRT